MFALGLFASACRQQPASSTMKDFPGGIRYEKLEHLNDGARVLTQPDSHDAASRQIVVPGEILWCDHRGTYIVGEKASAARPAQWMDANWERKGFFILNPSAINSQATSDEEKFGRAVTWFETREEFDKAVEAVSRR